MKLFSCSIYISRLICIQNHKWFRMQVDIGTSFIQCHFLYLSGIRLKHPKFCHIRIWHPDPICIIRRFTHIVPCALRQLFLHILINHCQIFAHMFFFQFLRGKFPDHRLIRLPYLANAFLISHYISIKHCPSFCRKCLASDKIMQNLLWQRSVCFRP